MDIPHHIGTQILNKILVNKIQLYKKFIHQDPLEFISGIQGWFNIWKSINILHHSSGLKKKKHMILLADARKNLTEPIFKYGKNSQQNRNTK